MHGFGFSFGLRETLQFAGSHLLTSLVCFNVGVEFGQIAALAVLISVLNLLFARVVAELDRNRDRLRDDRAHGLALDSRTLGSTPPLYVRVARDGYAVLGEDPARGAIAMVLAGLLSWADRKARARAFGLSLSRGIAVDFPHQRHQRQQDPPQTRLASIGTVPLVRRVRAAALSARADRHGRDPDRQRNTRRRWKRSRAENGFQERIGAAHVLQDPRVLRKLAAGRDPISRILADTRHRGPVVPRPREPARWPR